eukprot:scaffold1717_cov117-Cylindrotheca_fusiformis.AAC.16
MKNGILRKRQRNLSFTGNITPSEESNPVTTTNSHIRFLRDPSLSSSPGLPKQKKWDLVSLVLFLIHLGALSVIVSGFVLGRQFHNGNECEMTFSGARFLEIESSYHPSPATKKYKLYKFVDRRDPRYQRLLEAKQPLLNQSKWCRGDSTMQKRIVLYVPGHWGSYTQSRSLGAHGLQLTQRSYGREVARVLSALGNDMLTDASKESHFIYDVYSVDFSEQGAALHGKYILYQSDFVASTVRFLADACSVNSVTIVAHSMGGLVARLAPIQYPATAQLLKNIITLATPHSNPLYAFDKTIQTIHQRIQNGQSNETLVISFSGGLKDEMIKPSSCFVNSGVSFTVLTSHLLGRGEFGMDHQAIVWCHGVLHQVRRVIWALSTSENRNSAERLQSVQTTLGTEMTIESEHLSGMAMFRSKYGALKSVCIECAMIYNLPVLLSFVCFVGGFRCTHQDTVFYDIVFLVLAILVGWWYCDLSKESVVVLCLVANLIQSTISRAIPVGFLTTKTPTKLVANSFLILLFMVHAVCLLVGRLVLGTRIYEYLDSIFFLCTILYMYLLLFLFLGLEHQTCDRAVKVNFVSLVLIVVPVVLVGTLSVTYWDETTETSSWYLVVNKLLLPISIFCGVKGFLNCATSRFLTVARSAILTFAIFRLFSVTVHRGHGYAFANLLQEIAWVHAIVDLVQFVYDEMLTLTTSSGTT